MKKLLIFPAILCCSLLFANNGSKSKKAQKAEKAKQEKKVENKQAELNASKGTPVVTYKNFKVERRGSKQVVPAE